MKTKLGKKLLINVTAVALLLPLAASASLVNNGGFENLNTYVGNPSGYMLVNSGDSTTIPDWTVGDQNIAWIQSHGPSGLVGTEGSYFLDLTGIVNSHPFGAVVGTTMSTIAGQTYDLTFDVGRGNGEDASPVVVLATVGAQSQTFTTTASATDPGAGQIAWQTFTLQFQATDSSTSITINGTTADDGNGFIGLDNVRASAVPEASTLIAGALLLLPFGASAFRILRRNRAA